MIKKLSPALIAALVLAGCSTGYNAKKTDVTHYAETPLVNEFDKNIGDRVFFAYNSSDISSEAKGSLEKQAIWLKAHPTVKATIQGHCDERGTREYNIALGERRANSVKVFLERHGVDAQRLDTISYGKEMPAVIGDNEESYSQNRRGVTVLK